MGDVFAEPPDEHRDLPHDLLATDRGAVTGFRDYKLASDVALTDLVSTACTVFK